MDCPVCQTQYVKGKVQRCHVCGWELSPSCLSMVGPLRVEHQISMSSLEKIQAWAHYVWSTQQAQKEEIARLQRQLKKSQQEEENTRIQLEQSRSRQQLPPAAISPPPRNPSTSTNLPFDRLPSEGKEVWEWLIQRFAKAEEERSQLQSQLAQLQGRDTLKSKTTDGEEEDRSALILPSTSSPEKSAAGLPREQMRDLELLRMELQSRVSLQLSQFQAVERLKEQFQEQIETVTAQMQHFSTERDRLHSQLSAQQERFDRQQREWETLQTTLEERCHRLESQLHDQQVQIQQLKSEHCDRLASQIDAQQSQIQQLQTENADLQTAMAERDRLLERKEQEQRERMETYIEEVNQERRERDRQQSSLNEQLQQLRKSWQSRLTQQQTTVQQKQKDGEERLSEFTAQQTHLHDQIAKILTRCNALESSFENLQNSLRGTPRTAAANVKRVSPPVYTKYK